MVVCFPSGLIEQPWHNKWSKHYQKMIWHKHKRVIGEVISPYPNKEFGVIKSNGANKWGETNISFCMRDLAWFFLLQSRHESRWKSATMVFDCDDVNGGVFVFFHTSSVHSFVLIIHQLTLFHIFFLIKKIVIYDLFKSI